VSLLPLSPLNSYRERELAREMATADMNRSGWRGRWRTRGWGLVTGRSVTAQEWRAEGIQQRL
jgi:hypothetical protein